MCVQNFDDSQGLAIRITYRISLRSSSLWEPRHPLLKVVRLLGLRGDAKLQHTHSMVTVAVLLFQFRSLGQFRLGCKKNGGCIVRPSHSSDSAIYYVQSMSTSLPRQRPRVEIHGWKILDRCGNDPSAGSPISREVD